ncbi:glutamate/aspartate:proton symporter GltP, partial [Acinetobacter baumannii]
MKNFKFSLAWQILIALILGIVVGAVLHNQPEIKDSIVNNVLTPLGKIFISLI